MTKLLVFFGLLFGIFYFFYRRLKAFLGGIFQPPVDGSGNSYPPTGGGQPAGRIDKGDMAKCPVCGVYFPAGTGVKKGKEEVCSAKCAG